MAQAGFPSSVPFATANAPGVRQPPTTDASTSSVTASPDVSVSGTLAVLNATVQVTLSGRAGVGVYVNPTSYQGTITPEISYDNGITWTATAFLNLATATASSTLTGLLTTPSYLTVILGGGSTHARLKATAYVSGSATVVITTTAVPLTPGYMFGKDSSSKLRAAGVVASGLLSGTENGLVILPLPAGTLTTAFGGTAFGLPLISPVRLGGTPFTLRATGAAFTPPVVTATQPPQPVMTFNGKFLGTTVNSYVIDSVNIRILAPAATSVALMGRLVKRQIMYASTVTAAPAAGAVPTGAALAYTGAANGGGTYQYKYVAVDIWGNEGTYSGASLNVAPAANNGVTVTCPAVPAGAAGYNIYRTLTGPGVNFFYLGRTNTTTFRDITPDSSLVLLANSIGLWGTKPNIDTVTSPVELVMEKFVALALAPTIISTKTYPGAIVNNRVVTIAPAVAVGRYRIPGEVEGKAFLTTPTITTALARDIDINYAGGAGAGSGQLNSAFGDIAINSFNIADAAIGGTFVVWGHSLVGVTDAVPPVVGGFSEGTTLTMKWVAPPVFSSGEEIAIELGCSATAASVTAEVYVTGRYL